MSIDARIIGVTYPGNGTAELHLEPADSRRAPAGQPCLVVLDAPPGLEAAIGTQIWGGSSDIMVGETRWAERVGYTRIRLVPKAREARYR